MTSLLTKALSCVGLMRVAEHGVDETRILTGSRNHCRSRALEAEGRFKKAVTDLEATVRERDEWKTLANDLGAIVEATKDDALLWRNARDKRAGKRGKANG